MSYSQPTASERKEFYELSLSLRMIAKKLGRHQSTLSREWSRNQNERGLYLPDSAHQKVQERRQQSKSAFSGVTELYIAEIKARLKQYHSPKQIAGRLKREGKFSLSHETIYQMIYANHEGLKEYQSYLRQGRGKRRKRGGSYSKRGQIPGRVRIEHRPLIADAKTEIGRVYRIAYASIYHEHSRRSLKG